MAWNRQTFRTRHSWHKGHEIAGSVDQPSTGGYVGRLPSPIYAEDEWEWIIDFYEYWTSAVANQLKTDFGSTGTTAKLYLVVANVEDAVPLLLATGAITEETVGGGYNRVTFQVAAGAIPTSYAGSTQKRLIVQITATGYQRTAYQDVSIIDNNGTGTVLLPPEVLSGNYFTKQVAAVNQLATGATTIYTVPTGYRFVCLAVGCIIDKVTTPGTPPTVRFGTSTAPAQLAAARQLTADAANEVYHVTVGSGQVLSAAEVLQGSITVAATHASGTLTYYAIGFLVAAIPA